MEEKGPLPLCREYAAKWLRQRRRRRGASGTPTQGPGAALAGGTRGAAITQPGGGPGSGQVPVFTNTHREHPAASVGFSERGIGALRGRQVVGRRTAAAMGRGPHEEAGLPTGPVDALIGLSHSDRDQLDAEEAVEGSCARACRLPWHPRRPSPFSPRL